MTSFFIIFLGICNVIYSFRTYLSNDYHWHYLVGEYIVKTGHIPKADIFSWYGIDHKLPFISHEYLSDIIMYFIKPIGMVITGILLKISFYYFLVKNLKFNKDDFFPNIVKFFYLIISIIVMRSMENRPFLFSILFFNLFFSFLNKLIVTNNKKYIIYISLIQLLWVNIHGGSSSLIMIILLIYLLFPFINEKVFHQKNKVPSKLLFICLISTFLVSFINPNTYKIVLYPYLNMADSTMIDGISEWASPNFHGLNGIYLFVVLFFPVFIMMISKTKKDNIDYILIFMFLFMSLRSIRFMHFYIFVATYILGRYPYDLKLFKRKLVINKIPIVIACSFALIPIIFYVIDEYHSKNTIYSDASISKIIEINPQRLYNDYDYGGYLSYLLKDTDIKIFINSIADIYTKNIFPDYYSMMSIRNVDKLLDKYDFDCMLLIKGDRLIDYMRLKDNYELVFEDEYNVIFIKGGNL